jgi:hypothetical protein
MAQLIRDHPSRAMELRLMWHLAARFDDVTNLTHSRITMVAPEEYPQLKTVVFTRPVIWLAVNLDGITKTTRRTDSDQENFKPSHRADHYVLVALPEPARTQQWLNSFQPTAKVVTMTAADFRAMLAMLPMPPEHDLQKDHFTLHSIKQGALQTALLAMAKEEIPETTMSERQQRLGRHKVGCAPALAETSVRYVAAQTPAIAIANAIYSLQRLLEIPQL